MKKNVYFITIFSCLQIFAFCKERSQSSQTKLIGGDLGSLKNFPSTMLLKAGCTAAKISEDKIITAAHCVINKSTHQLKAQFSPKENTYLEVFYRHEVFLDDTESDFNLKIIDVSVSNSYIEACKMKCRLEQSLASLSPNPKDLAVITIEADDLGFNKIPIADTVNDFNSDLFEAKIVGFGCEVDANKLAKGPARFKTANALFFSFEELLKQNFVDLNVTSTLFQNFYISKGVDFDLEGASLCPGDSGGPLYVREKNSVGPWKLAGVNSFALPRKGSETGVSVLNAHAKVNLDNFKSLLDSGLKDTSDFILVKERCKKCKLTFALDQAFKSPSDKVFGETHIARMLHTILKDAGVDHWIIENSIEISKKQGWLSIEIKLKSGKTLQSEHDTIVTKHQDLIISYLDLKDIFLKSGINLISSKQI